MLLRIESLVNFSSCLLFLCFAAIRRFVVGVPHKGGLISALSNPQSINRSKSDLLVIWSLLLMM